MCPQPPVSIPFDSGGDVGSTDEEVVLFLGRRRVRDPIPSNVISDVNPYSIDPRNSPEGIWFLFTSKDSQSLDGGIIKVINGYWRSMGDCRILTGTPTVGRKTTREFYVGQAPFGDRTGWRMQEYCTEQIAAQANNKSQDSSTLCRFFLQNDERSDNGEQCDPVIQNDADCEYIEYMLLGFLEQEERNSSPRNAGNGSQVAGEGEQRQQESSSRPPQDSVNENSMEGMQDGYDFSKEDFLELKDLYDPVSSSSSSDNSSLMSMNSDECFDAEALLRDIENEGGLDMEEHVDYRFSVTTSVRSDLVVIQPPPAFGNNSSLVVSENGATNSTPAVHPTLPASTVDPQSDGGASTSGSSQGSHGSGSHSGSSQGGSPSKRSRSKSVRRMTKLGKRYCCFGGSF